jgi:WD40 repeat protein
MTAPNVPPILFLSHSGADTESARELKRRLLDSPEARAAGLRVWLDKDDLVAGLGWQAQLEKVIDEEATAFAVQVGSKGIVNWVDSEVRLALSRARNAPDYPFIPILAEGCSVSAALPAFARQYHAVRDPLNDPEEFAKLLGAVLRQSSGKKAIILESPFVGLKAMTEADADRFFGRGEELAELIGKLKWHRLVAIVADSGAGKSSLAQAGLIPKFRGGALADSGAREPDDRLWHVVVMRPRRDPLESLKRGVTEAAERLGRSAEQCAALRKRIDTADPSETAYAIRCDLPVGKTETLLLVDQFEELLTETEPAQRGPFVDLLMALAAAGGFRTVFTLRADYFNLCRPFATLFEHMTQDNHDAVLRLRRITDQGIAEAVRNPLGLAGHSDVSEQDAVITSIRRDISDRAGDLALVQMALYAMWHKHRSDGVTLLVAYTQVEGVAGALAHEAEHVRTQRLDGNERALLAAIFIRLVRLGETGGATRRVANVADFDEPRRILMTRLAAEECGRLLLAGEKTIEIAHEALITQWPWLWNTLYEVAGDIRILDLLMEKARRWNTTGRRGTEHLATGAEREEFKALSERRPVWLLRTEREFVGASNAAEDAARNDREKQRRRTRRAMVGLWIGGLLLVALALTAMAVAAKREVLVLTSLAHRAIMDQQYDAAMRIALQGLPAWGSLLIAPGWSTPEMSGLEAKLAGAAQLSPLLRELRGHGGPVYSAAFSPDGASIVTASQDGITRVWDAANGNILRELKGRGGASVRRATFSSEGARIVTASTDGITRVWDTASGEVLRELKRHGGPVVGAAFSPDGERIVTASTDGTAWVWDTASGGVVRELQGHGGPAVGAAFSPDGARIVIAWQDFAVDVFDAASGKVLHKLSHNGWVKSAAFSRDGARLITTAEDSTATVWDVVSGQELYKLRHDRMVFSASFSPDGGRIVTASQDGITRLWDAANGTMLRELKGHGGVSVWSAAFSPDGAHIITASDDGTARTWDPARGGMLLELKGHSGRVYGAAFSADGARIVTASDDKTARVWDTKTGKPIGGPLTGHAATVYSAAFSPDGKRIVTTSEDKTARLWDAATGEPVGEPLTGHTDRVYSAAFSPDGARIVTGSGDRTARVWDTASGRMVRELKGHSDSVHSVAFSPDGMRIFTAADEIARVWDAASGEMVPKLTVDQGWVQAFSPDGARIATSHDRTVKVWDASSGKPLSELAGRNPFRRAQFSTDGTRVVTTSWDAIARVWDTASGELLRELKGDWPEDAAFSTDGTRIVTAYYHNAALWDVSWGMTIRGEELVRRVCNEKLVGAQTFTKHDATDPILTGLAGTNPCERRSPRYWINLGSSIWSSIVSKAPR